MVTPRDAIERVAALRQRVGSPRLLDRVREALSVRHYSYRTEEAYAGWVRRFIVFHSMRHPAEMGDVEINAFLSHLAVDCHVAAATQNQALAALLFLYREVLGKDVPWLEGIARARRPEERLRLLWPRPVARAQPCRA